MDPVEPTYGPALRNTLFRGLSGRHGDVSGTGDVRDMLTAVGGTSGRTRSGINLTAAAKRLGVSRRTVERWVKSAETGQGQRPSPAHGKRLAATARRLASTKAGRALSLRAARAKAAAARDVYLSITGLQGPSSPDYFRDRTTQVPMSPDEIRAALDAYEQGGERGFVDWATRFYDGAYLDDWRFGRLDEVRFVVPGTRSDFVEW